jgi:hypothetical protein
MSRERRLVKHKCNDLKRSNREIIDKEEIIKIWNFLTFFGIFWQILTNFETNRGCFFFAIPFSQKPHPEPNNRKSSPIIEFTHTFVLHSYVTLIYLFLSPVYSLFFRFFFSRFFFTFQTVFLISASFCAYLNNLKTSSTTNSEFQAIFSIVYPYINPFSIFFGNFC